jgi:DNA-binding NtrC family response regulator
LHNILTTAGYRVTRAENLETAIQLASAAKDRIDVVISDHDVPPGSALDVLQRLKESGYRGRAIVYTSRLTPAQRAQYSQQSLDAVVEKKDDAGRLLSIMKVLHGERP